jgi:hypothetical protein
MKPRSGILACCRRQASGGLQFPCAGKKHAVSIWGSVSLARWCVTPSLALVIYSTESAGYETDMRYHAAMDNYFACSGRLLNRLYLDLILVRARISLAAECIDRGKRAGGLN